MSQGEILGLLEKYPKRVFKSKEIKEKLKKSSSTGGALKKLRERDEIGYRFEGKGYVYFHKEE